MTDRERLIELLRPWLAHISLCAADDLLAKGVVFAESLRPKGECEYCGDPHPASDCVLPDGTERMLVAYPDGTFLGKPFIHVRKIKFCPYCGAKMEGGSNEIT